MKETYEPDTERAKFLNFGGIRNQKIVDIGFGNGRLAIVAASTLNCEVICFENDEKKFEEGRKIVEAVGLSDKITLEKQDARGTSYPDGAFPTVVCFYVLHHVDFQDRKKVLNELLRITKNTFLFAELTPYGADYFDKVRRPEEKHTENQVPIEFVMEVLQEFPNLRIQQDSTKFSYFLKVDKIEG